MPIFKGKQPPAALPPRPSGGKRWFGKKWVRIVAVVVVVCVVGGVVVVYNVVSASNSPTSTTTFRLVAAQTGSVEKTVSGTGTVSNSAQDTLTAPDAGTVDSVSVKAGDTVTKGQTLLHINSTTAQQTLASKQSALTQAQNSLASAQAELDTLYIYAPMAGRIKSVAVSAGDTSTTVSAVGYLCYLSTSRSMTLTLSSVQTQVSAGQTVNVTLEGGSTVSGTVTAASSGQGSSGATVTIGTDTPAVGSSATVATTDGKAVGSGTLALTSYYKINTSGASAGSSGSTTTGNSTNGGSSSSGATIADVYVSENQMVSKMQKLFKTDATSVNSDIANKQAAVTAAQSDVTAAQASLDANTVTSPVDGTVVSVSVKSGDSVASGATLIEVMDPTQMQTEVTVNEDDINSVKVGQTAHVTLDAISGKTYTGTVNTVNTVGTNSNGVATFNVMVGIQNPDNVLVGMSTNVEIVTESVSNVVTLNANAVLSKRGTTGYIIPASSVTGSDGKTKTFNDTDSAALVQQYGKQVTLGLSTSSTVEIKSGLNADEQVAIPVTVNLAAIKSLSSGATSSQSSLFGGGAAGGFGGGAMPGGAGGYGGFGGGTGGYTRRSTGGTGNTTGGGTTSGSTGGGTTSGGTGNANANAAGGTSR